MERLLHYVWKYKLYASTSLATTEGLPIAVIVQAQGAPPPSARPGREPFSHPFRQKV